METRRDELTAARERYDNPPATPPGLPPAGGWEQLTPQQLATFKPDQPPEEESSGAAAVRQASLVGFGVTGALAVLLSGWKLLLYCLREIGRALRGPKD
jgi:hypothetical protein